MKAQAFVIALITMSLSLILAAVAHHTPSGALVTVMDWLSFWAFLPFGLAVGCGVTNSKPLLIATTVVTVLIVAPRGIPTLSRALAPIGAGLLIGTGLQRTLPGAPDERQ